jgi:hypothetical protein
MPRTVSVEAAFQAQVRDEAIRTGWHVKQRDLADMNAQLEALGQPPMVLPGLWFHAMIAYRSEPGWPDVFLVRRRDRRIIVAELKTDKAGSKLTPRQAQVMELLQAIASDPRALLAGQQVPEDVLAQLVTVQAFVWRPSDWPTILEVLR